MEIEAIPTEYAGVLFRSKLEATWARFFDIIGLAWEYEPRHLEGWLPDFLIDGWWLAEVKPLNVIGTDAMHSPVYEKAIRPFDTVLLGDGPGDALGLVVRRTKAGDVFPRYLFADIDDGPAKLTARRLWPVGYQYPLVQIWRGVVATADTWEAPPFRRVVTATFNEYIREAQA